MKKIITILLYTSIIALILSSCKSSTQKKQNKINSSNVVVWKVYDDAEDYIDTWQRALNDLLEEKNAGYTVNIEMYGDETIIPMDALTEMKDKGEQADVITLDMRGPYSLYNNGSYTLEYIDTYQDAAEAGLLLQLDDYLNSDDGKKLKTAIMTEFLELNELDGKIYGVSQTLRQVSGTAYNKEYLEKYNIDPASLSPDPYENEDILKIILEKEGAENDRFAVYSTGMSVFELPYYLLDECYAVAFNGEKIVSAFETDEFRSYVEKLYEFKDKNFIHSHFIDFDDFFATSISPVKSNENYDDVVTMYVDNVPIEKEVVVIPDMDTPPVSIYYGGYATGVASWTENKDNALDFLNRLYTDEDIANLIQHGIEGETYTVENGKAICDFIWTNTTYNFTNQMITLPSVNEATDKLGYMEEYFEKIPDNLPIGFRFDGNPVSEELNAIFDFYMFGEDDLRQLRADNIDNAIADFNAKFYELGLQKVLDEVNSQYDKWKAVQ